MRTGQTFRDAAAANDVRTVITPAVRGDILDDLGRPLVDNKSALTLSVDRSALLGTKDHGASTLARLASVLGTTPQAISDQIRPCTAEGPQALLERLAAAAGPDRAQRLGAAGAGRSPSSTSSSPA